MPPPHLVARNVLPFIGECAMALRLFVVIEDQGAQEGDKKEARREVNQQFKHRFALYQIIQFN